MTSALQATIAGLDVQDRLLTEFRRSADQVPAYRALLEEGGVGVDQVRDLDSFARLCPRLSKSNTFDRFSLAQLSAGGALHDVAGVLTSSGHGGRFAFGVTSRKEASASASFTDTALEATFGVSSRATLFINCLPMGVIFDSNCMTVATISVREDMAVALVQAVDGQYEQILLAGDPLFMKRLTDYAGDKGIDWRHHRAQLLLGGEFFGECFRDYFAHCLGLGTGDLQRGGIMSSFGVGELGLHLCFETPATVSLRRAAAADAGLARDLVGGGAALPLAMIFAFDPQRIFVEILDPDADGYGALTISMLDPHRSVPLLRYQTGDVARLLDGEHVDRTIERHGRPAGADNLPATLVALRGRGTERLPNGSYVSVYKDALYADHQIARSLTGAFRLIFNRGRCTMHVQLVRGTAPTPAIEQGLLAAIAAEVRPGQLVLWPYAGFPFGMGLDYERKFSHYVPGEAGC